MAASRTRRIRRALAGALTLALSVGLAATGVSPALADDPPITLGMSAVPNGSDTPISEIESGAKLNYHASVGCPDPSGCGPVTLEVTIPAQVEFVEAGFDTPSGATYSFTPSEQPGNTGGTLTVSWNPLGGAVLVVIPAQVSAAVATTHNGSEQIAHATLTAATGPALTADATVILRAYERPELLAESLSWADGSVLAGTQATTSTTISGIANANAPSTLTFTVPGPNPAPAPALDAADAFDLVELSLSSNPGGATVTFALEGGDVSGPHTLPAGVLTLTAPAGAVGYTVVASRVPAAGAAAAEERTVAITAEYTLRETRRSGGSIVDPSFPARQARATGTVTNSVSDSAPGAPAEIARQVSADITINTVPPAITSEVTWTTESGDNTSVYESGEPSTATVKVANSGATSLHDITIALPSLNSKYFEFQVLTDVPTVRFPAGATAATIQYTYADPLEPGAPHNFAPGESVPGPESDSTAHSLGQVTGVTITFTAPAGGGIDGHCDEAGTCAAQLTLNAQLRDAQLTSGAPITPPAANPGETVVGLIGRVTATGATGSTVTEDTTQATLRIVKPQLKVSLAKTFGDGTDEAVYPLTGVAKTGDHYDPQIVPPAKQGFVPHKLQFTAQTEADPQTTEKQGARELTITDPQTEPTLQKLSENPFNTMMFTQLEDTAAVCVIPGVDGADDTPVASRTVQEVWVLDSLVNPSSVTLVPLDSAVNRELVVGIQISITPAAASGRFPVNVRCETDAATMVQFRHAQVHDGTIVSPENLSPEATPGLFNLGNTALLVTGKNTATANGNDALYLVDLLRASVYKNYVTGAKGHGVQGEPSPTSFLISGVPANERSVATRVTDGVTQGSTTATGRSFDLFELTAVSDAHLGPDQQMTVSFVDATGAPIGPTGSVAASRKLPSGTSLTDDEVADSQSARYLEFQRVAREIEFSRAWADGEMARVAGVTFEVTRPDPDEPLQRFGAFSLQLDAELRSHLLSDSDVAVSGTPDGTPYQNIATIQSREPGPVGWGESIRSSLEYRVFAARELFASASAQWVDAKLATDDYLVAKHHTPSRVTLTAENRTAVGVADVAPAEQWSKVGSIQIGLESLSVGTGGLPDSGRNPFAITDFSGVTSVIWPVHTEAKKDSPEPERRVGGSITYEFDNRAPETRPAPVDAPLASLNPTDPDSWPHVVGITITWEENGKFVGINRPSQQTHNQGVLAFTSDLRDFVRAGYTYDFDRGDPSHLDAGASIDGADQGAAEVIDQYATLDVVYGGTLAGFAPAAGAETSSEVLIDVAKRGVSVDVSVSGGTLYRDTGVLSPLPQTEWTISNTNDSNIPVTGLWLATDQALLDRATWPDTTPGDYTFTPGSAFDSFSITRAKVIFPSGSKSATVWAMDIDGVWSEAMPVTDNNTLFEIPETNTKGPLSWADAVGVRVEFEAEDEPLVRIDKRATGQLVLLTQLRGNLRTDANELAPGTEVPGSDTPRADDQWLVTLGAAGTLHVGTPGATLVPRADDTVDRIVLAGAPRPFTGKYTKEPTPPAAGATSVTGHPGSWVNFYLVIGNEARATSNLYNFSLTDVIPAELRYNAANPSVEWEVTAAPERFTNSDPEFVLTPGTGDSKATFTWGKGQVLKPGEFITVRFPLQVTDGLAAGAFTRNTVRTVGHGIEGVRAPITCSSDSDPAADCTASATVTALRGDSVRVEKYLDATHGGASTAEGAECDASTLADWADGTWVRNPCITQTTTGATLKYRLKLINSGNIDFTEMRFVDETPKLGDQGAVLNSSRGSQWTPTFAPGSVKLLTGAEAEGLGARGDASLGSDGFRYSASAKPCVLDPDAYSGANTLECADAGGQWSATPDTNTQAFGADIQFAADAPIKGGEFVIVEFEMAVPQTSATAAIAWNTAAVTARSTPTANWLPAAESPRSGAETQDTSLGLTLTLEDAPATRWHLGAQNFELTLACTTPGAAEPTLTPVKFTNYSADELSQTITIPGLPRGGTCEVVDENYVPTSETLPGQYGKVSDGVTGYSFTTDHEEPITLASDASENTLTVTNSFAEATLDVGVEVTGTASSTIAPDAEFTVDVTCEFGDVTENFGPFLVTPGSSETITGLPTGASCSATETDHRGANPVTAEFDGEDAEVSAGRTVTLTPLDPGAHEVLFTNTFAAGAPVTVFKRVELPDVDLAIGDVEFEVSCMLGGYPLDLGDRATLTHTFAPGETEALLPIAGLPVDATCTVHESEAGGATLPAPDRTVTVLADEEVIVEMVNVFEPASLELLKTVAGPGAGEARVPHAFNIDATCTRELTIGGEERTVTDFSGTLAVTPGQAREVADLPTGSICAVTEPDLQGAESAALASLTPEAPDTDPAADTVEVALAGPDSAGDVQPTRVEVTNTFAATEGLGATGSQGWLAASAFGVLLLGAGALMVTRRRQDV